MSQAITKSINFGKNVLDNVISFFSMLLREIKKGPKELFAKLEKWLDEIFGYGQKVGDNALTEAEKRAKDKQRKIQEKIDRRNKKYSPDSIKGEGIYNGKILSKSDIEDWAKLLKKKYGTSLKKIDKFDDPKVLAQFDPNTNTILYTDDVTEYLMAHEHYHAEEMHKLGFDEYVKDGHIIGTEVTIPNKIRQYKREKYVYEQLKKNARKFNLNTEELYDSFMYFDIITARLELELKKLNLPFPK